MDRRALLLGLVIFMAFMNAAALVVLWQRTHRPHAPVAPAPVQTTRP